MPSTQSFTLSTAGSANGAVLSTQPFDIAATVTLAGAYSALSLNVDVSFNGGVNYTLWQAFVTNPWSQFQPWPQAIPDGQTITFLLLFGMGGVTQVRAWAAAIGNAATVQISSIALANNLPGQTYLLGGYVGFPATADGVSPSAVSSINPALFNGAGFDRARADGIGSGTMLVNEREMRQWMASMYREQVLLRKLIADEWGGDYPDPIDLLPE